MEENKIQKNNNWKRASISFHYQVKALQTLGHMFSFISMLSYSLKLSLMVKAGYFLLLPPRIWTKYPPHGYWDSSPSWICTMYIAELFSSSQGPRHENSPMVSWSQLGCDVWPNAASLTISLVVSSICPSLEAQPSPQPSMSPSFFFFFSLLECQQIQQDFVFDSPTCPYCLLYICLAAVQFPSFPCPNVVIGYCCLLRNERCYLKGCYH